MKGLYYILTVLADLIFVLALAIITTVPGWILLIIFGFSIGYGEELVMVILGLMFIIFIWEGAK